MTEPQPSKPNEEPLDYVSMSDREKSIHWAAFEIGREMQKRITHPTTSSDTPTDQQLTNILEKFAANIDYAQGIRNKDGRNEQIDMEYAATTAELRETFSNGTTPQSPTTHDVNKGSVDDKAGDKACPTCGNDPDFGVSMDLGGNLSYDECDDNYHKLPDDITVLDQPSERIAPDVKNHVTDMHNMETMATPSHKPSKTSDELSEHLGAILAKLRDNLQAYDQEPMKHGDITFEGQARIDEHRYFIGCMSTSTEPAFMKGWSEARIARLREGDK